MHSVVSALGVVMSASRIAATLTWISAACVLLYVNFLPADLMGHYFLRLYHHGRTVMIWARFVIYARY